MSLAASAATLDKAEARECLCRIAAQGEKVIAGVKERIARHGVADFVSIVGHPSWSFLILRMPGVSQWESRPFCCANSSRAASSVWAKHTSASRAAMPTSAACSMSVMKFPAAALARFEGRMGELLAKAARAAVPLFC